MAANDTVRLGDHPEFQEHVDDLIARGVGYERATGNDAQGAAPPALLEALNGVRDPARGFVVLDSGPPAGGGRSIERELLSALIIALQFGDTVTENPREEGRPFFPVTVIPGDHGRYGGTAHDRTPPGPHTDASSLSRARVDVVTLHCVHPAESGGQTVISNGVSALDSLDAGLHEFILRRSFHRQDPYHKDDPTYVRRFPICQRVENRFYSGMSFRYHPTRIANGQRMKGQSLTAKEQETLRAFERHVTRDEFTAELRLKPGQTLMINNHFILHNRREFTGDHRLLERHWAGEVLEVD
jgi:hypothetical protein